MKTMNYKRFPAEWEAQEAIMMAMPDESTDWNYILEEAELQYRYLIEAFTREDCNVLLLCRNRQRTEELLERIDRNRLVVVETAYNDTWTRDYGPLSIEKEGEIRTLDFGFNGWGLKFAADKDNLVNLNLAKRFVFIPGRYRNQRDFVLEGGSVESDGNGTILTTTRCLCSPNRNGGLSKPQAAEQLATRLGASHVLWLDYGALAGDDTDSHIDTLARLAPENTIIFTGCRNPDDEHFEELLKMKAQLTMFRTAVGDPFNLIELPLPDPVYDEAGDRLPATYANYLITDKAVFMPSYNQSANDELALRTLQVVFHDRKVVPVNCLTLIKQHGSLHCATMQLPKGVLNPTIYE